MNETPPYRDPDRWGACASEYERFFQPLSDAVAELALERLGLEPGVRFLDVAAGPGAVAIRAARRGAKVLAVDFAAGMLERLERNAARAGVAVETRAMDAQALDLPDASFAAAGSSFGLIFCPEPGRALTELRRVLEPGGRAVVTSMGHPARSPLMALIVQSLLEAGARLATPTSPAITLDAAAVLERALKDAGFRDIEVQEVELPWPIEDAQAFWRGWALVAPPTLPLLAGVPQAILDEAGEHFVRRFAEQAGSERGPVATSVLLGMGRR